MLLRILEITIVLAVVVLAITQVLLPLAQGRPVWPLFRRRQIETAKSQLQEALDREAIERDVQRMRAELEAARKRRQK
jgi:predicted Holliday junction resolvase-like endonuclease